MRARRVVLALTVTFTLLAGVPAAVGAPGAAPSGVLAERDGAGGRGGDADLLAAATATEQQVLAALNARRAAAGVPALTPMTDLGEEAAWWARQSAQAGSSAVDPEVATVISPWRLRGELYANASVGTSVDALVDAMVAAASSVALDRTATGAGVGYATNGTGRPFVYVLLADDPWSDLSPRDRFADETLWLASHGVISGWPDGTVRPTSPVTREAMAAFLYRFVELDPALPTCDPAAGKPYTDVSVGSPFCGAIAWLGDASIATGYADGTFRPGAPVTRAAMAAFLYRWDAMWNHTDPTLPTCDPADERMFSDVAATHPFCGAIEWLASTGVADGWPDGTFRPNQNIARQAMAAFLFRFNWVI